MFGTAVKIDYINYMYNRLIANVAPIHSCEMRNYKGDFYFLQKITYKHAYQVLGA